MKFFHRYQFIQPFIAPIFILLFVYTATSKLLVLTAFRNTIDQFPFLHQYSFILAWAIPVTELIISACLFFPVTRTPGLYGSLALMILFTAYIAFALFSGNKLPCSCGGVISKMTWTQHLVFNIFFTGLAIAGIKLDKFKELISRRSRIPVT